MGGLKAGAAAARLAVLLLPLAVSGRATAQVADNAATPAATPAALPVPAAPVIALPTPGAPPTPIASPTPRARRAAPTPTPTVGPAADAGPAAVRPSPSPPPVAPTPTPLPSVTPSPSRPIAPATVTPEPVGDAIDHYWFAALAAVVLAAAALVWVVLRRRAGDPSEAEAAAEQGRLDEVPIVSDDPAPVADRSSSPAPSFLDRSGTPARAHLTLAFRPIRAGLNLLSATSENLVSLVNDGDAPAEDIRLQLRLVTAHAGLDAKLAEIAAEPVARPVVPAFALAAGETREVSAVGALPREAVQSLTAAGRPMFVPVVALAVAYRSGDEQRTLRQAFAIGVERVDSAKLAPFWLDGPARSYDQVAARPHGPALER